MASFILGITGKKRSGKDTVARRLVEAHGFTRIAFADPLKDVALALDPIVGVNTWQDEYELSNYGIEVARLSDLVTRYGWEATKETPEVRRTLQRLGVAVRTHVDEFAWIDVAQRTADEIPGPVVIADVRFPNEFDHVTAYGEMMRVTRPGLPTDDAHVSETALDDYVIFPEYDLVNDGTIAELNAKVDEAVAALRDDFPHGFPH